MQKNNCQPASNPAEKEKKKKKKNKNKKLVRFCAEPPPAGEPRIS